MKRTFAVIGFSYMLGLILMNYIFEDNCIVLYAVITVLLVLSLIITPLRKRTDFPVALISILLSAVIFTSVKTYIYNPAVEYTGIKCQIKAQVLDYPTMSSSGNYCYPIKTQTVNDEEKEIKMYLYVSYDICADPYDEVSFTSYPFIIGDNDESYYRYFRSKRTYIGAFTKYEVNVRKPDTKPFMSVFTSFKGLSMKILEDYLDTEKAGFARGILFGDKVLISDETLDDFSKSGASHILAVSGLHMAVWVFGLYRLLLKLHTKEKTAGIICIMAAFSLVCVASFSASVMRSAIMTSIYFSSALFNRRADALNSLGTAVFFLSLTNPFIVCDISFLMTVFATLGIILSSEVRHKASSLLENRKGEKALTYVVRAVIVSISASLFVYPITVNVFGTLSILNWLTNLLIVPLLAPCMFLCGILVAYPGVGIITYPVKYTLEVIIGYILGCVRFVADIPFSFIETENMIICKVLPIAITLAVCLVYNIRRKSLSAASLACLLSISIVTVFI